MTTTNNTVTMTPAADAAAPASSASSTPAQDSNAQPAVGSGEPSSTVSTDAQAGASQKDLLTDAPKDSAKDAAAQGDKPADTDKSKPDGQSSETDKAKDAEGKEGEDAQKPVEYQLTAPEGMEIDADALSAAVPILQKHNVPQEAAQELTNVAAGMVSKAMKQVASQHTAKVQEWHDATVKEFGEGGEAEFSKKVGVAQKAMNKFFSEDEKKMVRHYGFGNFPALFRMAYAMGSAMQEDSPNLPAGNQGAGKDKTLGQSWYPEQKAT